MMITPERAVQTLAEWSYEYARKDNPDYMLGTSIIEFAEDYHAHYRTVYCSDDEGMLVIDVALGSFDHGAGNATLVFALNNLALVYEGDAFVIARWPDPYDPSAKELVFPKDKDPR
jgi:hypothetical protein